MPESEIKTSFKSMSQSIKDVIIHLDYIFNIDTPIGIQTGFNILDEITTGLHKGSLIVIGGRPAMGKTALLSNIITNIASNQHSVAAFSLDDSSIRLTNKMMSSIGGIDITNLSSGNLELSDWPKLNKAVNELTGLPIYIDDSHNLSIENIRLKSIELNEYIKQNKSNDPNTIDDVGLELIVIDYLQLISNSSDRSPTSIAFKLKALAIELNIPVIVTSQINRSIEGRANKRPKMSDIYADEDLEHYADQILFIYRDDLYKTNPKNKGITELIITKNNAGPLANVKLGFEGEYQRFRSL